MRRRRRETKRCGPDSRMRTTRTQRTGTYMRQRLGQTEEDERGEEERV